MELDVVCGMEVDPTSALAFEHEGRVYHFCSKECLDAFQDEPDVFVGDEDDANPPVLLPH
jgi:YHS domain-containing protein